MYVPAMQTLHPGALRRPRPASALPYPLDRGTVARFYLARNAIYHLFRALGFADGSAVLAPAYHSGNEVKAMRAAGATIRYYRVGENMLLDPAEVRALCDRIRPRALFLIHFLGIPQPVEELAPFCRERGIVLVEDCALAFLSRTSGRWLGSFGDYSIFCLYKTLPVPDGGLLVRNAASHPELDRLPLEPANLVSTAGRVVDLVQEAITSRAEPVGRAIAAAKSGVGSLLGRAQVRKVAVGDMGFDLANVNLGMSSFTRALLPRFDYEEIVRRRRENWFHLETRLRPFAWLPPVVLPEGACPLFYPILVRDKAAASAALREAGVCATEFWNQGEADATAEEFPESQRLRDHVLEIPLHQDVTIAELDTAVDAIRARGIGRS